MLSSIAWNVRHHRGSSRQPTLWHRSEQGGTSYKYKYKRYLAGCVYEFWYELPVEKSSIMRVEPSTALHFSTI
jgi:hypothetical protein